MARLEYVRFSPWREYVEHGVVAWEEDNRAKRFAALPQVFWATGEGWSEVNHWALEKSSSQGIKQDSVRSLLKHLRAYADFLEEEKIDWRHFPIRKADRALVRYRGKLVSQMESGVLRSSTARARMNAVIQFYRHARAFDLVDKQSPLWEEKSIAIPLFDSVGFERTLTRKTTDLAIQNRTQGSSAPEDGLFPLSAEHMAELLRFVEENGTEELRLMLLTGFFTGARVGSIAALRIEHLENARPDPALTGFWQVRAGPGTSIPTKFDVSGFLLFPDFLLAELKTYFYSSDRLKREIKALKNDKTLVFLTRRVNRYSVNSIGRLVIELKATSLANGLKFMGSFKFHQTRATYGTMLMESALEATATSSAIALVKEAMLHKNEATTFRYVKFLEMTKGKQFAASEFSRVFAGMGG